MYRTLRRHPNLRNDLVAKLPRQMSAPELIAANLRGRELILDPILASDSLALLYGPRGLGKTFVALGIAWAVAGGGSFLGWTADRPRQVLYIDGAMAATDLQARLRMLGSARHQPARGRARPGDGAAPPRRLPAQGRRPLRAPFREGARPLRRGGPADRGQAGDRQPRPRALGLAAAAARRTRARGVAAAGGA